MYLISNIKLYRRNDFFTDARRFDFHPNYSDKRTIDYLNIMLLILQYIFP